MWLKMSFEHDVASEVVHALAISHFRMLPCIVNEKLF